MAVAPPLVDPVPGNIGLLPDANTIILFPFVEPDEVYPTDQTGALADLEAAATNLPLVDTTGAWASTRTRAFTTGRAFVAADVDAGSSLLQRDVTVQAIIAVDTSAFTTGVGTLICRGIDGSAAEYYAYGVDIAAIGGGVYGVGCFWMNGAGTLFTHTPVQFTAPGDGVPFLLTVTRRWDASDDQTVRVYVGDILLEEVACSSEVGGGTTGQTSIGARRAVSTWGNYFQGWIDELKVTNHEMSHEEVRAVWRRLTEHQPNGVATLRALSPPGAPFLAPGEDSDIGRLIKVAGQAVGLAASKAHELLDTHLPNLAYADTIGRWERLVGLASGLRTALDTRRTRVVGLLERENGYSPAKVKDALAGAFDLSFGDVDLIEFSPTITDGFDTLEDERWFAEPTAAWSIVSNTLQLSLAISSDIRFDPAAAWSPCHLRTPVDNDEDLIVQVKLSTYWANLPTTAIVGLFLYNRVTNDALWFGVKNDGGTRKLGWVQLKSGVLGAFTTLVNPSTDAAYYLRIVRNVVVGSYSLYYSTTDFVTGTSVGITGAIENVTNVGMAAMATASALAAALTATFDDFLVRTPQGGRAFHWYAYRDLLLSGSPDMFAADGIIKTIKPAHTYAHAITSMSLLCDDDGSVCDGGPMGGI